MIAVIKEIPGGFETTVLNDDMTQPTMDEQHAFLAKYASSVLKPVFMTATAGQEVNVVTKMTINHCNEGEGN